MIASVGIPSANRLSVSEAATGLPSVAGTLQGWFRALTLGRVTKSVVEGEIKEVTQELNCRGVVQPFGPRELKLKPEGERSWNWQMLHTTPDIALKDDEKIFYKGTPFRVMGQQDFSEYGYITYELVQDYRRKPE